MSSLSAPLASRPRSGTVAAPPPPPSPAAPPSLAHEPALAGGGVVMEGYLLKKKRKKMQGMARRFFRLSASGALSYAFNPTSPLRDSIFVSLAFISASRKHRTFHIDGGTTVYHCKALTLDDFDRWASALKRFIPVAQAASGDVGHAHGLVGSPVEMSAPAGPGAQREEAVERVLEALGRLSQPIADIELLAQELRQADVSHAQQQAQVQQQLGVSPSNTGASTGGSKFRFLGKRSNSTSGPSPAANPARSPSFSGASGAAGQPAPFSLNGGATLPVPFTTSPSPEDAPAPTYLDAKALPSAAGGTSDLLLRQLQNAVATLKHQHAQLASAVHALPAPSASPSGSSSVPDRASSPSASLYASRSPAAIAVAAAAAGGGFYPSHTRGAPSRASSRASFASMWSDGADDWHDAVAVPGEFVDEDWLGAEGEGRAGRESSPEEGEERGTGERGGASTIDESDDEGEDSDEGEETEDEFVSDGEAAGERVRAHDPEREQGADAGARSGAGVAALKGAREVQRRAQLPAPVSGDEFSMLSMLRKNVGKDLSTISFPVTMNEPLSALQRLAEEFEYSELLDRAAQATDPVERLMLVAVWAVSGTSGNNNPLLGETYECIRPEKGFQFVSEKVSHHPPVLAFAGDAPERGWHVFGHIAPSQKFWGRSMEVFVSGEYCVRFADNNEVFTIRKPSSFVRNLVAGTKYLEVVGDLVVTTSRSAAQATVAFKEGSTWGGLSGRNKIEGKVLDANGDVAVELVGRWDDAVDQKEGKNNFTRLWQIAEFPPNPERYYGFSRFAVTLNELTPLEDGFVAPTDSRLRPDQLAFERGDIDEAERLKALVEEKQRTKRKEGRANVPKWFRKVGEDGWEYGGEYFEAREKKAFEDPDIFC
ncbi:Oxysterol-binding protein 3 [Rhodotorula kratochvilovae]